MDKAKKLFKGYGIGICLSLGGMFAAEGQTCISNFRGIIATIFSVAIYTVGIYWIADFVNECNKEDKK